MEDVGQNVIDRQAHDETGRHGNGDGQLIVLGGVKNVIQCHVINAHVDQRGNAADEDVAQKFLEIIFVHVLSEMQPVFRQACRSPVNDPAAALSRLRFSVHDIVRCQKIIT